MVMNKNAAAVNTSITTQYRTMQHIQDDSRVFLSFNETVKVEQEKIPEATTERLSLTAGHVRNLRCCQELTGSPNICSCHIHCSSFFPPICSVRPAEVVLISLHVDIQKKLTRSPKLCIQLCCSLNLTKVCFYTEPRSVAPRVAATSSGILSWIL